MLDMAMTGDGAPNSVAMRITDVVRKTINAAEHYPFLFIGPGLSRRYLGLPDWESMLRRVADEVLAYDFAYEGLASKACLELHLGSLSETPAVLLPKVASLMEGEVNDRLFSDPAFMEFREEVRDALLVDGQSPMRVYLARMLAEATLTDDEGLKAEYELLREIGQYMVSGVIATAFDKLPQMLFPDNKVYVGACDMLYHDLTHAFETYMICGSITEPNSLVFTSEDYALFDKRRDYVAAKLATVFGEYPIIFIGYDLHDPIFKSILSSVAACAGDEMLASMGQRMVFVCDEDWGEHVGTACVPVGRRSIEMTLVSTKDYLPVFKGIAQSEVSYDIRAVRGLRNNVFEIAKRLDPISEGLASELDDIMDNIKALGNNCDDMTFFLEFF